MDVLGMLWRDFEDIIGTLKRYANQIRTLCNWNWKLGLYRRQLLQ